MTKTYKFKPYVPDYSEAMCRVIELNKHAEVMLREKRLAIARVALSQMIGHAQLVIQWLEQEEKEKSLIEVLPILLQAKED